MRDWLGRFEEVSTRHGAMVRIWVEGARTDHLLQADTAAAFDWGRRQMARVIGPRSLGDVDVEALILLGLVDGYGSRSRSPDELEAALHVIETTFLDLTLRMIFGNPVGAAAADAVHVGRQGLWQLGH